MFKSLFVQNQPEFDCNKFSCEVIGPKSEEPIPDPKAKPAKGAPVVESKFSELEESTYGANKIYYEFKRGVEASEGQAEVEGVYPEVQIKL